MVTYTVPHADPGYLTAGVPQLPLDTVANIQDAWTKATTSTGYTTEQVATIQEAIRAAASRFMITLDAPHTQACTAKRPTRIGLNLPGLKDAKR